MTPPRIYRTAKPQYLTPGAFGQHFDISKMTVYRLMHAGEVKWIRVGRSMRIPVSELARYTKAAEFASSCEVWGEA